MRNTFGNAAAAVGLSAAAFMGPACAMESQSEVQLEPIPEAVAGPQQIEVDEQLIRVIQIQDSTTSSGNESAGPSLSEEYYVAGEMLGRATLGALDISFAPEIVTLPLDVSSELCAHTRANDEAGWYDTLYRLRDEASILADADALSKTKYDATVFDFADIEICPPGGSFEESGYNPAIAGQGSFNGPVYVYERDASVIGHELMHEMGPGHGDQQMCDDVYPDNPEWVWPDRTSVHCYAHPYGDGSSLMGTSDGGLDGLNGYSLAYLDRLHPDMEILQPSQITHVTESGTYELNALLNDTDGPKLLFIPDDEQWLERQITQGSEGRVGEVVYEPELQEGFYIEVSGTAAAGAITDQYCQVASELDFEQSPECRPSEVNVRIMRAADYRATQNQHPHTVAVGFTDSLIPFVGANEVGEVIFEHHGLQVELLDIQSDPALNATGTAQIKITLPE